MHFYVYFSGADFIASGAKLVSYWTCLALIWNAKKAGRVAPPIPFLFWLLLAICQGSIHKPCGQNQNLFKWSKTGVDTNWQIFEK